MIRKKPAPDLIRVETGFPKSILGLDPGIMLHQKINIDRSRLR